jgi:hypothetical protein
LSSSSFLVASVTPIEAAPEAAVEVPTPLAAASLFSLFSAPFTSAFDLDIVLDLPLLAFSC